MSESTTHITEVEDAETEYAVKPEEPSLPIGEWLRDNLFSSAFNSVLTIVTSLVLLFAYKGLLDFVFSEERNWVAPATNARLLLVFNYPQNQFGRVWVSLALLLVLAGLSMGMKSLMDGFSIKRLMFWSMSTGAALVAGVIIHQPAVTRDSAGEIILDANNRTIRESFADAVSNRLPWLLVGVLLVAAGFGAWQLLGEDRRRTLRISTPTVVFTATGLIVASLWLVHYGHYGFNEGEFVAESGRTVADTSKQAWTVMWLLLIASYFLGKHFPAGKVLRALRPSLNALWLLAPFIIFWVVLRDPDFDWSHVWSTDLPMFLAFAILGSAILWILSDLRIGELGRLIALALVGLSLLHFVAAFTGWYSMLQKARLSFVLLGIVALAAPNFAGERSQRFRLIGGWIVMLVLLHYFATVINSPSTVVVASEGFTGGLTISLFVAVLTLIFSFPLGVILALGRTSNLPIFRVMSTAYIEMVRGVPLITILIFFSVILNLFLPSGMEIGQLAAIILGYSLFSAAYLAENVRGGLQAIRRGQYEAADALGLTAGQRTSFIVLPQALRISIPPLVGQVIATFKETSLIAIIGAFDLLRVANNVIPAQTEFLGVKRENLLIAAAMYWVFTFSISKYSLRLERKLGVGER